MQCIGAGVWASRSATSMIVRCVTEATPSDRGVAVFSRTHRRSASGIPAIRGAEPALHRASGDRWGG